MGENQILQELSHPFLVNMLYAFQDRENLFVVMKSFDGGDFRYHLIKNRVFSEEQTRFFAACVVSALEFTHKRNIIHRDLKPENLVFDARGYLHLTDFGVARYWRSENSENTSGTPGYMAPEVLCHRNHSFSADFYALGVMVYECIAGRRPHVGKTRKEIKDQVLAKQAVLKDNMVVGIWSAAALDFCNRLIQRKRERRLGENGIFELKNHPWLKDFDWAALLAKQLEPPYSCEFYSTGLDRRNNAKDDEKYSDKELMTLRQKSVQSMFNGYDYNSSKTIVLDRTGESSKHMEDIMQSSLTNTS